MAGTPDLVSSSSIGAKDKSIDLKIDLKIDGQKKETAVFAADPTARTSKRNMVVWGCGNERSGRFQRAFGISGGYPGKELRIEETGATERFSKRFPRHR